MMGRNHWADSRSGCRARWPVRRQRSCLPPEGSDGSRLAGKRSVSRGRGTVPGYRGGAARARGFEGFEGGFALYRNSVKGRDYEEIYKTHIYISNIHT